jgi:hypothetical protein
MRPYCEAAHSPKPMQHNGQNFRHKYNMIKIYKACKIFETKKIPLGHNK